MLKYNSKKWHFNKFKQFKWYFKNLYFNENSKRNDSENITVNENCFIILACPGENMIVGNQNPPSDIEVIVKRINPKNKSLTHKAIIIPTANII